MNPRFLSSTAPDDVATNVRRGPGEYCPPRLPPHFDPSSLEVAGTPAPNDLASHIASGRTMRRWVGRGAAASRPPPTPAPRRRPGPTSAAVHPTTQKRRASAYVELYVIDNRSMFLKLVAT